MPLLKRGGQRPTPRRYATTGHAGGIGQLQREGTRLHGDQRALFGNGHAMTPRINRGGELPPAIGGVVADQGKITAALGAAWLRRSGR